MRSLKLARQRAGAGSTRIRCCPDPRRRAILRLVVHSELTAGEDRQLLRGDEDRAVSQHLTVLKNAGLLSERRQATRRLYRARPRGLAGLRQFLDEMWASSQEVARDLVEAEGGIRDDGTGRGIRDDVASADHETRGPNRQMTEDSQARLAGAVTASRRPPVRQPIVVRSGRRHTFDAEVLGATP